MRWAFNVERRDEFSIVGQTVEYRFLASWPPTEEPFMSRGIGFVINGPELDP